MGCSVKRKNLKVCKNNWDVEGRAPLATSSGGFTNFHPFQTREEESISKTLEQGFANVDKLVFLRIFTISRFTNPKLSLGLAF